MESRKANGKRTCIYIYICALDDPLFFFLHRFDSTSTLTLTSLLLSSRLPSAEENHVASFAAEGDPRSASCDSGPLSRFSSG